MVASSSSSSLSSLSIAAAAAAAASPNGPEKRNISLWRSNDKWVHAIPVVVLLCFFVLWWFSFPGVLLDSGRNPLSYFLFISLGIAASYWSFCFLFFFPLDYR